MWNWIGLAVCGVAGAWYIWYVAFYLPAWFERLTPEEKDKIRQDWEEARKSERD